MRLFFALEADPDTAMQIADWRDTTLAVEGRPVPPANFHITLAFVGELSHARSERLADAVDERLVTRAPRTGDLLLDTTGYWAKTGIYWLGPTAWPEDLERLAAQLRGHATAAGARKDGKSFRPHITLYRRCDVPPAAPTTAPAIRWPYGHFSLMESIQGKRGVSYRPIASWALS